MLAKVAERTIGGEPVLHGACSVGDSGPAVEGDEFEPIALAVGDALHRDLAAAGVPAAGVPAAGVPQEVSRHFGGTKVSQSEETNIMKVIAMLLGSLVVFGAAASAQEKAPTPPGLTRVYE